MKTKVVLLLAVLFVTSIVAFGKGHERHERKFHKSELRVDNNKQNDFRGYKFDGNLKKFNRQAIKGEKFASKKFGQKRFGRNEAQMFDQKRFGRNEAPMFRNQRFGRNEAPMFRNQRFNRNEAPMFRHQRFNMNDDTSYMMHHSILLDEVTVYAKRIVKQPIAAVNDSNYMPTNSILLDEVTVYAKRI